MVSFALFSFKTGPNPSIYINEVYYGLLIVMLTNIIKWLRLINYFDFLVQVVQVVWAESFGQDL